MGALAIIAIIAAWSVVVVEVAGNVGGWPWPLQALFFVVAGLAWIAPLKPLLRWMETGKWRGAGGRDGAA